MTLITGTPVTNTSGSTTYTIVVPTGVTSTMVGLFAFGTSSSAATTFSAAAAGGTFTQLDARAATNTYVGVFKGTGLVAGQSITLTLGTSSSIYLHHFYQDSYDFTAGTVHAGVRSGSSTVVTSSSITPASGATVAVIGVERTLADATTVTATSSGGETITRDTYATTDANPDVSVFFGHFTASAAAARTATLTYDTASSNAYAAVLATTVIVPPAPVGKPIKWVDASHSLQSGQAFYTSATDTLAVPLEVRAVPTGYPSVSAMLASSPFYVAHRGGSLDWPEMSLHAYTQSVFWGVGALEISLARTSDGVWFGLHDATLDRTSGTSGFTASAHTWAEVQAYSITASATNDSTQPVRSYMRWEEIIAAYYKTHVLFVDPKAAFSYTTELLNMMDACPGTPTDRFVAKYYGVVSGWPQNASARGYKGWGYFYQADVPSLPAYQGRWDILGMDYTANSASWTAIMSYGKPVIGHIVPNATGATTAFGYGANGLMVSGVKEVIPRTAY